MRVAVAHTLETAPACSIRCASIAEDLPAVGAGDGGRRANRAARAGAVVGLALGVFGGVFTAGRAAADSHSDPAIPGNRAAVAAPNLRDGVAYDYGHVDDTSTTILGPSSVTSLDLDHVDTHAVAAELVGTVPLIAFTGLRTTVRGGFHDARRSLDALEPGSSQINSYGVLGELFVRDPQVGSFAVGAGFDRLEGDGGVAANQVTGSVDAQVFFPDFGLGPLDWFGRFEFRHRELEGDGQPFDVDADVYHVKAGARWYASPDVAVVFSGSWQRVEEEFLSEDDATGSLGFRWRLPLPIRPISLELFGSASAGLSEYKESPYRGDDRLVYGARAGLTIRLFSGETLVDCLRHYD